MTDEKETFKDENNEELMHYGTPQLYPGDPHGSGRYREGSGDNPNQHGSNDFLTRVNDFKKQGMSEKEIADALGISTGQLRIKKSIAMKEQRAQLVAKAKQLKKQGLSNVKIAEEMGLRGESTVRSLLNADSEARMTLAEKTANNLSKLVDERGMIDVGVGTERQLGISKEKMNTALDILQDEGYMVYAGRVPQVTNPGKWTTIKVLCPPGTEHREIYEYDKIHSIEDLTSRDGGDTLEPSFRYPASMSSSRLAIRYAEDGGADRDGQVEIRRGVKDLYLGEGVNYAQVRILVDGTHYIKGMGIYSDDLPDGVDVLFNSNKKFADKGPDKLAYLKSIKDNIAKDPDNPFGSAIKENKGQYYYDDPNGEFTDPITGHKQSLGLINKRAEEGDWNSWADKVPSQFLSKQPQKLIDRQLKESLNEKKAEYEEIMSLTNPTIKRELLESFADDCDSSSVHLKAAAFPGQKYQVILPLTTIKDTEVYAPNYKDGTQVALIRYPHGGTFEIPIVTVNNRNEEGIKNMGTTPKDAVGINSHVANRLSGADFDGDTVMVIPISDKIRIKSTAQLEALKDFDTKQSYQYDKDWVDETGFHHYSRGGKEFKVMNNTQTEMGIISNLITDMTLGGATTDELARAVKHSMVVIDAEKHKLDYKQSELDNGIAALHKKYQGHIDPDGKYREGAATLISRAKSEILVPERKDGAFFTKDTKEKVILDPETKLYTKESTGEVVPLNKVKIMYTDPNTGEKAYRNTNRMYTKVEYKDAQGKKQTASVITKDGKQYYKGEDGLYKELTNEKTITTLATQKSTKMAETKDAYTLSRGSLAEEAYAEYANSLKSLANTARLEALAIKDIPYSASAKKTYAEEVASLDAKLKEALINAPRERQAQLIANSIVKAKLDNATTELTKDQEKKIRQQALSKARKQVGAKRSEIKVTEKEWQAIQAGAISPSKLKQILDNADTSVIKQFAMPRSTTTLSTAKVSRLKNMANRGYTTNEIAQALGISTSTVIKYMKGDAQ